MVVYKSVRVVLVPYYPTSKNSTAYLPHFIFYLSTYVYPIPYLCLLSTPLYLLLSPNAHGLNGRWSQLHATGRRVLAFLVCR